MLHTYMSGAHVYQDSNGRLEEHRGVLEVPRHTLSRGDDDSDCIATAVQI